MLSGDFDCIWYVGRFPELDVLVDRHHYFLDSEDILYLHYGGKQVSVFHGFACQFSRLNLIDKAFIPIFGNLYVTHDYLSIRPGSSNAWNKWDVVPLNNITYHNHFNNI